MSFVTGRGYPVQSDLELSVVVECLAHVDERLWEASFLKESPKSFAVDAIFNVVQGEFDSGVGARAADFFDDTTTNL